MLAEVTAGGPVDRVTVKLVSGQSPADFADRAEGIAHGFGVHLCRVRPVAPGLIVLELVRRDALADPIPALPIPGAGWIWRGCRSAGVRTGHRGCCGCSARTS